MLVGEARKGRIGGGRLKAVLSCLFALVTASPLAAQTPPSMPPGTRIANVAELAWLADGASVTGRSNTDLLIVAERLDVALAPVGDAAFVLTQAGNGAEAFALAASPVADPARPLAIAEDRDGNGRYDPAIDRILPGGRTPVLAAGATLALLVVDAPAGETRIVAQATTGTGAAGTVLAALGDGGGDAVIGPTGAAATLTIGTAATDAATRFAKTQTVRAPDGSDRAVAGAIITYTLAARFGAAASAAGIEDPLPAGTRPVAGSLRLDGAVLTDVADADAGDIAEGVVRVRLGDVPAGREHVVTFAVVITD